MTAMWILFGGLLTGLVALARAWWRLEHGGVGTGDRPRTASAVEVRGPGGRRRDAGTLPAP